MRSVGFAVAALVAVNGFAEPILDFATRPGWRVDFGKFTDAAEAKRQFRRAADGAHVFLDRSRDDGNGYGAICGYGPGEVAFTATNCLVRLSVRAPKRGPIGRQVKLRFRDGEGEVMQWSPDRVRYEDGCWLFDYVIAEGTHDGAPRGTWGGKRRNGGKWDGPLTLWEVNWNWGAVPAGEIVFERVERVAGGQTARNVLARRSVLPLVTGKDRYSAHNCTRVATNDMLVLTFQKQIGWINPTFLPPGPNRWNGAEEMVLRLSEAVPGGKVELALKSERSRKVQKWMMPWTKEVRFKTALPYEDAYYLASFAFVRPNRTGGPGAAALAPLTVTVLGMEAIERRTAAEALDFDLETGSPLHIINRPEHRPVALLTNLTDVRRRWTGRLRVTDYFGTSEDTPFDVTLNAGERARIALAVPEKFGIYRVLCTAAAEGTVAESERAFAKLLPRDITAPWPEGMFRVGVNYHIARYSAIDRALTQAAMVAMGCKLSRSDMMSPSQVCPAEGVYDWTLSDRYLGELERHGIALDAIMYACPYWARPDRLKTREAEGFRRLYCSPMRPGLYRAFCEVLAARYGKRVAYYEVGNEWDLTDPRVLSLEDAMAMQREAMAGLHKGCPDCVCIPNGWACPLEDGHPAMRKDFQRRFITEAREAYDIYPIHLHGPFASYARNIRKLLAFREKEGLRHPWYSNETALTSVNGAEDEVAVAVWQKILFAWSHGSRDYIWYNLRGTGFDPKDGEQGYGLLTGDFYPRPGMAAFSGLVATFGMLKADGLVADTDLRLIARWKGEREGRREIALVGWDIAAHEPVPLRVRTDAVRVWQVDLMGNRTPAKVVNGLLVWPISPLPCALLAEGGTLLEVDAADAARAVQPFVRDLPLPALFPAEPQIVLDSFAQAVELYQANPATAHRTWKGRDDLSARVFLAGDAKVLRVKALVTDERTAPGDALEVFVRPAEGPLAKIALAPVSREGTLTRYETALAPAQFGAGTFAGARVGVVLREDDGEGCDGWFESAANLGGKDAERALLPRLNFTSAGQPR